MSRPDYLDENLQKLLGSSEPVPRLSKQIKDKIITKAIGQARKSSSRAALIALTKRVCSVLSVVSAAAAMIVFAVMFVSNGGKKAFAMGYAIADTIEALQKVRTVHSICTTFSGKPLEIWKKINPDTGFADWHCFDSRPYGGGVISTTPKGSCVWDSQGIVILRTNRKILSSQTRYDSLFEDLSKRMTNPSEDEKITIYKEKDPDTGKDVIVIREVTKLLDRKLYIDPVTKLPLRMHLNRADNMLEAVRTIHQYFYNVKLPKELFDFEIPPEAIVDYSVLDDPNNGMLAEGLTHEQASVIIVRKFFEAVISGDWETRQRLEPLGKRFIGGPAVVELLEVGKPYPQRASSGLVVPCKIQNANGEIWWHNAVVNWREIDGKPSVIITKWWGPPAPVKGRDPIQITIPRLGAIESLSRVKNVLAGLAPRRIDWEGITLAEVRIAIAGESLAVYARINDAASGPYKNDWTQVSNLVIYISNIDSNKVRSLSMRNIPAGKAGKQLVFREGDLSLPTVEFPFEVLSLQSGGGFELTALIPLSFFQVDPMATEFLFESAVWAAPTATSGERIFTTMFGSTAAQNDPEFFAYVTIADGD